MSDYREKKILRRIVALYIVENVNAKYKSAIIVLRYWQTGSRKFLSLVV